MKEKTLTLLGFASKSGKLSFGAAAANTALKTKKAKLIVISADVSEKSKKEAVFYADKYNIPHITLDVDMQNLSAAVGNKCGVLSVNDIQFANSILREETK